jgi:DMSO/TMAO reductase YedYZ molybdopterin-dependent catalytic subunit
MTYVIVLGLVMNNKQNLFSVLLLCGLALSIATIVPVANVYATEQPSTDLEEVEIREYEGENLSSINAFRENSIKGPQYINDTTYTLTISGMVNNTLEYTIDDVISGHPSYKKVVTLFCVEGWRATILWEGVLIEDLIEAAEVDPEATTVIFYAYDGYSTSMSLDYILDNNILIAYKMNNVTLPPERGYPFQLVAESKWGYKWIKWITGIVLSDQENYRGFWEQRGYSNDGDLDAPYFDDIRKPDDIIPEFPSTLVLPILITITLAAIIFRKKLFKT